MRVAEILSDLTSLRVCDSGAALALVHAQARSDHTSFPAKSSDDADLARAKALVTLHYTVKVPHAEGTLDGELMAARQSVQRATGQMERSEREVE